MQTPALGSGSLGNGLFNAFSISASGMQDASLRLNVAANNIANANTDEYIPARVNSTAIPTGGVEGHIEMPETNFEPVEGTPEIPPDTPALSQTDLALEFVNILVAKTAFKANAKVMEHTRDMTETLIDIAG